MGCDLWVPRIDVDELFWPEQQPASPASSCDAVDMDIFASYLDDLAQYESVQTANFKDLQFAVEPLSETKSSLKRKRTEPSAQSLNAARKPKTRKRVSTSVRVREEMKTLRGSIEQLEGELEDLAHNREARACKRQEEAVAKLTACSKAAIELENACLRELVASQRAIIARAELLITQSWQPLHFSSKALA